MEHKHTTSATATVFGYIILGIVLLWGVFGFAPQDVRTLSETIVLALLMGGAMAIIGVTVSVFWLWKHERSEWFERFFGPAGHVLHCGYCLSLWLSLVAVRVFHISFFSLVTSSAYIDFFISWWAVGFITVFLFTVITNLWLLKLKLELSIRKAFDDKAKS